MDLPENEPRRIASLQRYRVVDSVPEEGFDRIARLAARIFNTPYAFISLIDGQRQWFKSSYGAFIPHTPSDDPVCSRVITSQGVLIIGDTARDSDYAGSTWFRAAPFIRFYAGAPLRVKNDLCVGALSIADNKPRASFSEREAAILQELAAVVVHELELRRAAIEQQHSHDALRQSEGWYRSQLVQANDDLRQLAFAASHDLQEPLRGVAIHAQLLERRYRGQISDPQALEILDSIICDARRIRALVLDLLAFTEISVPELIKIELVDCGKLVAEVASRFNREIEKTSAHLDIGQLPVVRGVRTHLFQLFENLISNSLKYRSAEPPRVCVSATREKDLWIFRLEDNGIGVPPEYQLRIFGLFKRLHGREVPGTGMGLAICQKIVERSGGEIWVESEPGRGSTFCFTMPALTDYGPQPPT